MEQDKKEQQKKAEAEAAKREEARQQMLNHWLSAEAKERLGRIRLVKEAKVRQVEDLVIQMAQSHNLGGPVTDVMLCDLLNKISDAEVEVKIAHRGKEEDGWDDDDEGW